MFDSVGGWRTDRRTGPLSGPKRTLKVLPLSWSHQRLWSGGRPAAYPFAKRLFDIAVSLMLLPPFLLLALTLLILNPWFSRGKLFFSQERMGQHCRPIQTLKFRTMTDGDPTLRGAFDALDADRITPIGYFLRRTRLDELPQVINVLRGDMSLIGPRPDYFKHALVYLDTIPGYRERHLIRPGISGFAQVEVGYADKLAGIRAKVAADIFYIQNASFRFDLWIAWRTILVVFGCRGL